MSILPAMPQAASADGVELLSCVWTDPTGSSPRPAVKLEFGADEPGVAAAAATVAGQAVRHLYAGLELNPPRLSMRDSHDRRRAAVAFPWHRRAIAQAVGTAASRVAHGPHPERRELRALRAIAPGPRRAPAHAARSGGGDHRHQRQEHHHAADRAHRAEAGRRVGMTNSDGIYVRDKLVEPGDWTGFGGAGRSGRAGTATGRAGDGPWRILLRGIGYPANDVAVVTNVSADLGCRGSTPSTSWPT